MLSEKLRVALENLLPDAGEDETYLAYLRQVFNIPAEA